MGHSQKGLFVDTRIAGQETVYVFTWTDTTFVRVFQFQRQQFLHAKFIEDWQHLKGKDESFLALKELVGRHICRKLCV